jgi:predicted DNA-binding antitoxin AbrB/MazE fold protein
MSETITAIYEKDMLRPLVPLSLPERAQLHIQIVNASTEEARRQVSQVLLDAAPSANRRSLCFRATSGKSGGGPHRRRSNLRSHYGRLRGTVTTYYFSLTEI